MLADGQMPSTGWRMKMLANSGTKDLNPFLLEREPRHLKELFLKLRWMGMDSEAEDVSQLLAPDEALVGPIDTD
jgi:hypothetical protein